MIHKLIEFSLKNRYAVLIISGILMIWGIYSMYQNPIDAIPDLSENQVIIYTEWPGKNPQIIEDQITYPLVTGFQGLPKVKYTRAASMFGMSFIYLVFEDNADIYWARTRVSERISALVNMLPRGVSPEIGPDGSGVGHVLWYTVEAPSLSPEERRTLQDWYIKFALQNVKGVSEVASFGGFEKQYVVSLDPGKLLFYGITIPQVLNAIKENNNETSAGKLELSGIGYIIKTSGYLKSVEEISGIPVKTSEGVPLLLSDLGYVQTGIKDRSGIFDRDGMGEAAGGIIVMRYGENASDVIKNVKKKMREISPGLPEGVKLDIIYDRSELINRAVSSVKHTLGEEIIVVCIVVIIFLFNLRSALSIIIQLPITIAASFIMLDIFGISSNIMSLTGIALAIGVIVDNGIIITENAYRELSGDGR